MSIFTDKYYESKKLGEKVNWTNEQINAHATKNAVEEIGDLTARLVDAFNSVCNSDNVVKGMLDGINTSHRQLQSDFWDGMLNLMEAYSSQDEIYFDGRNDFSRTLTRKMAKEGRG